MAITHIYTDYYRGYRIRVYRCSYCPLPGAPTAAGHFLLLNQLKLRTASLNHHCAVRYAKYLKYPCWKVSSRKDGALNYAPTWRPSKWITSFHISRPSTPTHTRSIHVHFFHLLWHLQCQQNHILHIYRKLMIYTRLNRYNIPHLKASRRFWCSTAPRVLIIKTPNTDDVRIAAYRYLWTPVY